ncbi:MAG TPA: flagellar biosynthetic protein FliP, partial [Hyphomicrobium sp.]|nr:flagellar biosynthetic protein FliP [Hyphomicrobium sp.]
MKRPAVVFLLMLPVLLLPGVALAQGLNFEGLLPSGEQTVTGRMVQLVLLITMLSVAPGLLMMVTCFTRFVIVLSLLRSGLGLQTTPANMILVSLALFMTFYVMAPTFDKAWQNGLKP